MTPLEAAKHDDVFHFVAYVPHTDGSVYELDGLQSGPIRVGAILTEESSSSGGENDMDWLKVARDAIQARLSNYSSAEIKFNLMAVVQDKRTSLNEHLEVLSAAGTNEDDPVLVAARSDLAAEEEKRARWTSENERRRHNFLPFCVEYLRTLAASGKFTGLVEEAKRTAGEKRKRAEAWKDKSNQRGA